MDILKLYNFFELGIMELDDGRSCFTYIIMLLEMFGIDRNEIISLLLRFFFGVSLLVSRTLFLLFVFDLSCRGFI
jgi:hypothetical protein